MRQTRSSNAPSSHYRLAAAAAAGILSIGLTIVGVGVGVTPAQAAGACNGPTKSYYAGAQKATYQSSVYGVRANIEYQNPTLCGAPNSRSSTSAWAMLIPRTPTIQMAQSGYLKLGSALSGSTGVHVFGQYTRACVPNCAAGVNGYPTFLGPAPTGSKMYSVYLRSSDGRIGMYAGSTLLGEVNRSVTGEWSTDWSGQFAGETHDPNSDIPGTAANHVRFNYIQKYDSAGNIGFIQDINLGLTPTRSNYHQSSGAASVGGVYLDIWTN